MRIICLNLWLGKRFDVLIPFLRAQASTTDVFCFQETVFGGKDGVISDEGIRGNLFSALENELKGFAALKHWTPGVRSHYVDSILGSGGQGHGLSMFVKDTHKIIESGAMELYSGNPFLGQESGGGTGTFLYATTETASGPITIGTTHGLFLDRRVPSPAKGDTPGRLEQSRRLAEFFKNRAEPGVLMGDLNLRPDTQSVGILGAQMRNLIKEYAIANTRTREYLEIEMYQDYIADYAFVDKRLKVRDFRMLPDVVSDHAPLMLLLE